MEFKILKYELNGSCFTKLSLSLYLDIELETYLKMTTLGIQRESLLNNPLLQKVYNKFKNKILFIDSSNVSPFTSFLCYSTIKWEYSFPLE